MSDMLVFFLDTRFWMNVMVMSGLIFLDSMIGMKGINVAFPKVKVGKTMDLFVIGVTNMCSLISGAMPVS